MPRKKPKRPPRRRPSSSTILEWVSNIPDIQYDGTGTMLYCTACEVSFSGSKKTYIQQHISSQKHKAKTGVSTTSSTQGEFNLDLLGVLSACNISWSTLNNPDFRQFLNGCVDGTYSNVSVPSESTLRRHYLPAEYKRIKSEVCKKIGDNYISLSLDQAIDSFGRSLACVYFRVLDKNIPTQTHMLNCKEIEEANAEAIVAFINHSLEEVWRDKFNQNREKLLLLITNSAPYLKRAGEILKETYFNMLHLTCLAHTLNTVTETIGTLYPRVGTLVSSVKQMFLKAPACERALRQMLPQIQLPPETWLEAASYYHSNFNEIKSVISQFDSDETEAVSLVLEAFEDSDLINDLAYIHSNFFCIWTAIGKLENSDLSINDALNIVFNLRQYLDHVPGGIGENISSKLNVVLEANPGFQTICNIGLMFSLSKKEFPTERNVSTLKHYKYFKYAPVASLGRGRLSSALKSIFIDKRRNISTENLEALLMINLNKCDGETKEEEDESLTDDENI